MANGTMSGHRCGEKCCNDCGEHRPGACDGCDRRRYRAAARREKQLQVELQMARAACLAACAGK